jgi:anthranilate synthase component 1
MYSINFGERNVIGASPEMLVRVTGRDVDTFPIAGTSPLGKTLQETDALGEELKKDVKERAEHVMLVDLARNDLGRVCDYGTVAVPEFMKIERYSHVQHLVSRVNGRLAKGKDALDAFDAVFPAGTVTGAPKVRAMEILDELEPTRRGPYAGAVGYFALNGNLDTAITIRTLTATHSHVSIQGGAGIVADSVPRREWQETEHKARALVAALQSAGQRLEARK